MSTSRYIQITDWALLEYEYSSVEYSVIQAPILEIENAHNNTKSFVNGNISINNTKNVQDNSSIQVSGIGNRWAYLDIDKVVPYINMDEKLEISNKSQSLVADFVRYDRVKIHILSGFNLDGLDGIITQFFFRDPEGNITNLSANTFLSSDNSYDLNPDPLFIGERLYDKFIEFYIPSLAYIIEEQISNPTSMGTFSNIYSNGKLRPDTLIECTLHEIYSTDTINGNELFLTGNKYETSFLSQDTFALLGSTIKESSSGDFFEYYATWNEGFIEDYITLLNEVGGNWAIVHQIEVFEQTSGSIKRTANTKTEQHKSCRR